MATAVTMTDISAFNTATAVTKVAATADVADTAEEFTITPTKRDGLLVVRINNVSAANGTVAFSVAAGGLWAAGAAKTGTVAQGVSSDVVLEGGKYKKADGTIAITITPASGKKLKTDHTLSIEAIQLPA